MLRRWLLRQQAPMLGCCSRSSCRCIGEWQPRTKQRLRFSKTALLQGRARHTSQKEIAALRQHVNEEYGVQQRQRAQLRRQCGDAAAALIRGASRSPASASTDAMASARYLLTLEEAARKEMRRGKRGRTAMFSNRKKWGQ
ncbi:hypothetical protein DQ04_15521010 [Trypanosoma grayi]|uniref:hypothetical protein n=1 Tax=Trypanosoma grayi TaxID=71804 RepID=UPI0004F3FD70|nr:hypothetical protein DQ04_15521010 [Trypanosoma grayi]KEG06172.1 hypothetical protein DQ04_15521010 [Trypanosoma grayi]